MFSKLATYYASVVKSLLAILGDPFGYALPSFEGRSRRFQEMAWMRLVDLHMHRGHCCSVLMRIGTIPADDREIMTLAGRLGSLDAFP